MGKPDPIVTLNRRWRILSAIVARELRLAQIVGWISTPRREGRWVWLSRSVKR